MPSAKASIYFIFEVILLIIFSDLAQWYRINLFVPVAIFVASSSFYLKLLINSFLLMFIFIVVISEINFSVSGALNGFLTSSKEMTIHPFSAKFSLASFLLPIVFIIQENLKFTFLLSPDLPDF